MSAALPGAGRRHVAVVDLEVFAGGPLVSDGAHVGVWHVGNGEQPREFGAGSGHGLDLVRAVEIDRDLTNAAVMRAQKSGILEHDFGLQEDLKVEVLLFGRGLEPPVSMQKPIRADASSSAERSRSIVV